MTTNDWELPDSGDEFEPTSEGFKNLRKGYDSAVAKAKAAAKREAELAARISELEKSVSEKSLNELTKDLPANVQKHLAKEFRLEGVEPTEQNVTKWLDENAADYGYNPKQKSDQADATEALLKLGLTAEQIAQLIPKDQEQQTSGLSDEDAANLRATQALFSGRTAGNLGQEQVMSQLNDLDKLVDAGELNVEQLFDKFRQMGAPISGNRVRS